MKEILGKIMCHYFNDKWNSVLLFNDEWIDFGSNEMSVQKNFKFINPFKEKFFANFGHIAQVSNRCIVLNHVPVPLFVDWNDLRDEPLLRHQLISVDQLKEFYQWFNQLKYWIADSNMILVVYVQTFKFQKNSKIYNL